MIFSKMSLYFPFFVSVFRSVILRIFAIDYTKIIAYITKRCGHIISPLMKNPPSQMKATHKPIYVTYQKERRYGAKILHSIFICPMRNSCGIKIYSCPGREVFRIANINH